MMVLRFSLRLTLGLHDIVLLDSFTMMLDRSSRQDGMILESG